MIVNKNLKKYSVLTIDYDLDFEMDFTANVKNGKVLCEKSKGSVVYTFPYGETITVTKDDPWALKNKAEKYLMRFMLIDLTVSPAFSADLLPFSFSYSTANTERIDLKSHWSVDPCSVNSWAKACTFQLFIVYMILFSIVGLFTWQFGIKCCLISSVILLILFLLMYHFHKKQMDKTKKIFYSKSY